jgi:8-oxo-dGTP pyrophosphatase MutT (NUDIX family)
MSKKKCCFGFALVDINEKVLIVFENSYPVSLSKWGFPKGKKKEIDKDEFACMERELYEEVGIAISSLDYEIVKNYRYNRCTIAFTRIKHRCEDIQIVCGNEILVFKWVPLKQLIGEYLANPDYFNRSVTAVFTNTFLITRKAAEKSKKAAEEESRKAASGKTI